MLVQSIGPFTWLFKSNNTNTQIVINSRIDTTIESHFNNSGSYKYRGTALSAVPKREERNVLVQLSDQYQYLSTLGIENLQPDQIVTHPNTVVGSFIGHDKDIKIATFGKWYSEGDMDYCIIGPKRGETFWDNVGASIFVKCRKTKL